MIHRFHIENFKALRDITLELTPIHVLIGANDTGKTSILEAIAALCRTAEHNLDQAFLGSWSGCSLVWNHEVGARVTLGLEGIINNTTIEYILTCRFLGTDRNPRNTAESIMSEALGKRIDVTQKDREFSSIRVTQPGRTDPTGQAVDLARDLIKGVQYCRWDPRLLALPVAPSAQRRFRIEPSGFGLALCLDDILGYERRRFDKLEGRFRELFPQIESIQLVRQAAYDAPIDDPELVPKLQPGSGKGIQFRFAGGNEIPASQVSDGMLIILAYLAILHLPNPPRVLLVEEPENGVHPKRLQEVVSILREIVGGQNYTQIVISTHSPMLIDLFTPEEVTLCQKSTDGSVKVRRLSESATVREQMDVFTLGEIWAAEGDESLAKPITANGGQAS